jgi:phenylacetic acid degradation operon negative regulatory protein
VKAKTKMRLTFVLLDMLDLFEDLVFIASRPSYGRLASYWGYTETRAAYRAFERWQEQEFLEKVHRGNQILYRLGAAGKELLARRRPSSAARKRTWDGQWRMVVFDFPEVARKARDAFRRQLRQERMGCLQKSVWITPDPVIPAWKQLLKEAELTDWVLLFESAELGPVDDREIAHKVWSLDELGLRYQRHLHEFGDLPRRLRVARASRLEGALGQLVRKESKRYFALVRDDPLLPEALLPTGFSGLKADELHQEIRLRLRECLLGDRP